MRLAILATLLCAGTITSADRDLCTAGRDVSVRSISSGRFDLGMLNLAHEQAQYCADHHRLGHQCFERQFREHYREYPGLASVVAMTGTRDSAAASQEVFRMWRRSPGHWRIVNGPCRVWAYAMVRSSSGIWYAAGYTSN